MPTGRRLARPRHAQGEEGFPSRRTLEGSEGAMDTVTTEKLLDRWRRAESASDTHEADTLTWLLARERADEARRIDEIVADRGSGKH